MDTRAELHIAMGDASHSRPGKRTPLMRACASGHLEARSVAWILRLCEVAKTLLASGASIWRVDSRGWTCWPELKSFYDWLEE